MGRSLELKNNLIGRLFHTATLTTKTVSIKDLEIFVEEMMILSSLRI